MIRSLLACILCLASFAGLAQQQTLTDDKSQVQKPKRRRLPYRKYRFGSYGEILFQKFDYTANRNPNSKGKGSAYENRSNVSLPRLVFAFEYRFPEDIIFTSELEIENGGTGSAMEIEYEEFGEYEQEIEKAGEVLLEQFHISKRFSDAFNLRLGHMIVPVGLTNLKHMSTEYLMTTRSESEVSLIPVTWHETGVAVFGTMGNFRYEAQLVNGLNPEGFSTPNWVAYGKQYKFEEIKMTDPAAVLRLDYTLLPALRFGLSGYTGNTLNNKTKEYTGDKTGRLSIGSADFEYLSPNYIARGTVLYGHLDNSKYISNLNKSLAGNSGFPRTLVAQNALSYSFEAGWNILPYFPIKTQDRLLVFARYDYYNSMHDTQDGVLPDKLYERELYTAGVNYFFLKNMALKIDYSHRTLGKIGRAHV